MAERQSLHGKTVVLAEAATMTDDDLRQHLEELAEHYLPDADNERQKQQVRNLIARVSFELSMRDIDVPELEVAGSAA